MSKPSEGYNGWANYATWRVNLEVFDGYDPEGEWQTADSVEGYVQEVVFGEAAGRMFDLLVGWATAFTAGVNWQEIADGINEAYELADPDAETDDDD